jgi:murein DD-endopeptidase MepM/ murein hydrolase activator NlpD
MIQSGDGAQRTLAFWGAIFIILLLGGCQPSVAESPAVQQLAAAVDLASTPTLQPALAEPVVEYSEPPPAAEMPSFSLAAPEDENVVQEEIVGGTAVPSPTPTRILPSATPTPPNLRFTSPDEHYWFWRPIHEGQTNWTDKVYPYGGTRGGTLRPHHGVEFYVPEGTQVLAVADGTPAMTANRFLAPNPIFTAT